MTSPVYSQLQHHLTLQIENGVWQPGEQMPPERALAEEHGLSVGTVRKALDNLVRSGYCHRIQGKGTFVAEYTREQPVFYRLRSFLADSDAELTTRDVRMETLPAPSPAAAGLGLEPGAPCIRIFRNIQGRDAGTTFPAGCSTSYVPAETCAALLKTDPTEFQRHTLYHLLESVCGLPMIGGDELMTVCSELPAELRRLLNRTVPLPCFHLEMVAFTYGKKPLEYRESYVFGGRRGLMRRHDFRR